VREHATEVLLGLPGFRVVDAVDHGDELHITIELVRLDAPCPCCGVFTSSVKQRPIVAVADVTSFGRRVKLWWRKCRLRCLTVGCRVGSFTQTSEVIVPRARTTQRLRDMMFRHVKTRPVSEVADEFGVSWPTVWHHSRPRIEAVVDVPRPVPAQIGIDETTFRRPMRFATGIVDLSTGRLHELLSGRSKKVVVDWLHTLDEDQRDAIREVAMDPYSGFNAAIRDHTTARVTMDRFHAIRLANQMVTAVRCRRQQELFSHRGRKADAFYRARRDLHRAVENLTERQHQRLQDAFRADPDFVLEASWVAKEAFREIYAIADDRPSATAMLDAWFDLVAGIDIAEVATFAGTIRRWQDQFLAYFDTRLTNGASEGRNLVIKNTKRAGYGYRNWTNYRLKVLYRCT